MKIRHKILIYFSILAIGLSGGAAILIYTLFSNYRTDEFQQRVRDKVFTTLKFFAEVQQIDSQMLKTIDDNTVNSLHKEEVLIYDQNRKLVYENLDNIKMDYSSSILEQLNMTSRRIEFLDGEFDVVGVFFEFEGKNYYGLARAYDQYGLSKLRYLKYVLIMIFLLSSFIILVSSFLLSRQISQPLNKMASEISHLNFEQSGNYLSIQSRGYEIELLARRFNELMKRLNDSFAFQKHAIHHISHELKTPIAALVSNIEKMEKELDLEKLSIGLKHQKEDTKRLADIINTLLELSKVESNNRIDTAPVRIDELVFDIVEEYRILEESFAFTAEIDGSIRNEEYLTVNCNRKLIRLALINLAANCVQYSQYRQAIIRLSEKDSFVNIAFINHGDEVPVDERLSIFQRFYRGKNSKRKSGFGLGLVLTSKIAQLHNGYIRYDNPSPKVNVFSLGIPSDNKVFSNTKQEIIEEQI